MLSRATTGFRNSGLSAVREPKQTPGCVNKTVKGRTRHKIIWVIFGQIPEQSLQRSRYLIGPEDYLARLSCGVRLC